ncbi:MAG: electron transfer flavoprotein subunit beta/FixA family protein, partial [Lachnospiraceae bacterium]|nr:electron transfer flavoprotein subunit beta/FixA family protein [Lachnospiraceae bacterium]
MMLKILGCFKIVNDLDQVLEEEWQQTSYKLPDLSYVKSSFNSQDESGLELMLRFSEKSENLN